LEETVFLNIRGRRVMGTGGHLGAKREKKKLSIQRKEKKKKTKRSFFLKGKN